MIANLRRARVGLLSAAALFTMACGSKIVVVPQATTTPATTNLVAPAPVQVVTQIPATPAFPQETQTVSPGADFVWVSGYYNWTGDRHVWTPGNWVRVPRPEAVWVSGRWVPDGGGYTWVAGHWQ